MDWVEAYSDTSVMAAAEGTGLDLAQEMVDFIREIREYARAQNPDFMIIPQNAAEILEFGGRSTWTSSTPSPKSRSTSMATRTPIGMNRAPAITAFWMSAPTAMKTAATAASFMKAGWSNTSTREGSS